MIFINSLFIFIVMNSFTLERWGSNSLGPIGWDIWEEKRLPSLCSLFIVLNSFILWKWSESNLFSLHTIILYPQITAKNSYLLLIILRSLITCQSFTTAVKSIIIWYKLLCLDISKTLFNPHLSEVQ